MVRPLRQQHRQIFIVLGVMLPIVFSVGIAARRPVPTMVSLPGVLAFFRQSATTVWERPDLFANKAIQTRLLRESGEKGRFALELSGPRDFVKPDLIVYWVAGNSKVTDTLPDNALLLGSFSTGSLLLPTMVTTAEGHLLLYSLAQHEVIASSKNLHVP